MALDGEGERAAKELAQNPHLFHYFREGSEATREMREIIYNYESDDDDEDIVARALEIIAATPKPTAGGGRSGQPERAASKRRPKPDTIPIDHLSQPYRFIDLPDKVVLPEEGAKDVALNIPLEDGYCATIDVEWIAESPLLVGGAQEGKQADATVKPLKIGGQYVLPGATLRGLVRSLTEIVSYAKMTQGNWHYHFGLRDFVHPYFASESGVSKIDEVKGGFLTIREAREDDDPRTIVEQDGKRLAYELTCDLDWGHVNIASLKALGVPPHILREEFNRSGHKGYPDWAKLTPFGNNDGKYSLLKMGRGGNIDFGKIYSFSTDSRAKRQRVFNADPNGQAKGVMVVAGSLPGGGNKVYEYFITPNSGARKCAIARDTVWLFERMHSRPAKGDKLEAEGNWKVLRKLAMQENGPGIPVFHVGNPDIEQQDENFFFGLTRLFKVPHKRSVRDVLYDTQPEHKPRFDGADYVNKDFAENLFGYVMEEEDWLWGKRQKSTPPASVARKGRIAFGFAQLSKDTPATLSNAVDIIQMAPHASYAPFYLRGEEKDYSGSGARIAGRKAYFPRYNRPAYDEAIRDFKAFGEKQIKDVKDSSRGNPPSAEVFSHLQFLMPKSKDTPLTFTGKIRLHNVTAAEIGAVLFAITHGGDETKSYRHMIGRGKPFGAGQMRIGRVILKAEANIPNKGGSRICAPEEKELYDTASGTGFVEEGEGCSLAPFLKAFEDHMVAQVGPAYRQHSAAICEWLGMSSPEEGAKLAEQDRLFYKAYEKDPSNGRDLKQFDAYRKLREATQSMNSPDKPMGEDRLLPTPKRTPARK